MKCIQCHADSKLSERREGNCKSCGHRFAFEPTKRDPFTDGFLHAAIQRVSSDGRVKFHFEHVSYEVWRRQRKKAARSAVVLGTVSLVAAGLCLLGISRTLGWLLLASSAVLFLWSRARQPLGKDPMPRHELLPLFERYCSTHGTPTGLIETRPEPERTEPFPEELLDYSFDRAVICDRRETVDLLIANNFHFENNCAVLGVDGYPRAAFEPVRRMLRNNPRLLVLVLHDASLAGCRLAYRLRNDPAWFQGLGRVVDVGLRPTHARHLREMAEDHSPLLRIEPTPALTESEARWLAAHSVELSAVLPEQVIKRLFRAVTQAEQRPDDAAMAPMYAGDGGATGGDTGSSWSKRVEVESSVAVDGGSFASDADASDGGGDSFG
jgi:DNA-directed RNA polymerase subunit RPC12/RpoP